ncbi:MAG TPA: hypothetical protein VMZ26_09220 [Pyrinomonadaceae bacterium]|nr:hypothetical protein [Pyrinomonadaceae bacterium]
MKKALILSLMLGAAVVALPVTDAKAATTNSIGEPQINLQIGRNRRRGWDNGRTRTVTSTRTTFVNGVRFRETIRTTYFANGRTRTVVVNRVRLGGRRGIRNY